MRGTGSSCSSEPSSGSGTSAENDSTRVSPPESAHQINAKAPSFAKLSPSFAKLSTLQNHQSRCRLFMRLPRGQLETLQQLHQQDLQDETACKGATEKETEKHTDLRASVWPLSSASLHPIPPRMSACPETAAEPYAADQKRLPQMSPNTHCSCDISLDFSLKFHLRSRSHPKASGTIMPLKGSSAQVTNSNYNS